MFSFSQLSLFFLEFFLVYKFYLGFLVFFLLFFLLDFFVFQVLYWGLLSFSGFLLSFLVLQFVFVFFWFFLVTVLFPTHPERWSGLPHASPPIAIPCSSQSLELASNKTPAPCFEEGTFWQQLPHLFVRSTKNWPHSLLSDLTLCCIMYIVPIILEIIFSGLPLKFISFYLPIHKLAHVLLFSELFWPVFCSCCCH